MINPIMNRIITPMAIALLATACSAPTDIRITNTYHAPNVTNQSGMVLSLCSRTDTDDTLLQSHALNACPANTKAVQKLSHDRTWNSCPLLQKKRTTFLCVAGDGGFPVTLIHKPKKSELEHPLTQK